MKPVHCKIKHKFLQVYTLFERFPPTICSFSIPILVVHNFELFTSVLVDGDGLN